MIEAIGKQTLAVQTPEPRGADKSVQSIGQLAKAAVTAAREAGGMELPRNAQGIAASSIARGIDPASLFAAQVADSGAGGEGADPTDAAPEEAGPATSVTGAKNTVAPEDIVPADFPAKVVPIISEDPSVALPLDGRDSGDAWGAAPVAGNRESE